MHWEDIIQVTEIDREAFPSQLPPPNYQQEYKNSLARYLILYDPKKQITGAGSGSTGNRFSRWLHRIGILSRKPGLFPQDYIIGFVGLWIMVDEAHITAIAVRNEHRRQGLGELLLIAAIDLAMNLKTSNITLEVRASNLVAQNLYEKYGMAKVGSRRAYYLDNREDAVLMMLDLEKFVRRRNIGEETSQAG